MQSFGLQTKVYEGLEFKQDWANLLKSIDVVVHAAGVAHVAEPLSADKLRIAEAVNKSVLSDIVSGAKRVGARHVVLVSSIAVNGSGAVDYVVNEKSPLLPASSYAKSKLAGEHLLIEQCDKAGVAWTIIRPAVVYGPQSPGNFSKLVRLVKARLPLPFRAVQNKRSLLFVENLVQLVVLCTSKSEARNKIFVAADEDVVSLSELVDWIGEGAGIQVPQWSMPVGIMKSAAKLLGKEVQFSSLLGDFQVDASRARNELYWNPKFNTRSAVISVFKEE